MPDRNDVSYMLGEIHAKVNAMYDWQKTDRENHEKLEGRVVRLEKRQWFISGVAAAAGWLFSDSGRKFFGLFTGGHG